MDSAEKYCMKWNNYHKHIGSFLSKLCESEVLADVTLWVENQRFHCHRVILSACSPYFQEILSNSVSKHPVIVLAGINSEDIKIIIHFIYNGELDNISYERFISVLKTAELLKICGLTEVIEHIPPRKCLENLEEIIMMNDASSDTVEQEVTSYEEEKTSTIVDYDQTPKEKPKKQHRKYSEGSLGWALSDMEKGMTLIEASRQHKIPRSTLYVKAKQHAGLRLASRREHTNQDCQAAVQAVAGGLSLKRAAEQYGIPKTVLWRRVQKRLDICKNLKSKRRKQDRIMKLEENEKTSHTDQDDGLCIQKRLSESSSNKIKNLDNDVGNKGTKQYRLTQALNACKEGKMSQAVASRMFQVPKTSIWRRLQKAWTLNGIDGQSSSESQITYVSSNESKTEEDMRGSISVISSDDYCIKLQSDDNKTNEIRYMDSGQCSDTPLIILTSNETLPNQDTVNDDDFMESLNVSIQNVVEVVSDKEDINWP